MRISTQKETGLYQVKQIHNVSVVDVAGELSRNNIRHLEEVFQSLTQCGQLNVILNFEKLSHIDYQLVRRLADHIVTFQCEGGDIKMANVNSYVQSILQVMGLEEEFFPSIEDALLNFLESYPSGELQ
ncbi:Anti-sigma F factor antagonist [sediment metagenome]|uniref:Anti-sigma F factor antagonist n=1 Tax=sediment metagenome TaxID=749907 RepID=D9PJW2_9ZZZZ